MVRRSNYIEDAGRREAGILVGAIKAFQDAVDRFDAAAAARLGVNETDLRCLALLKDQGPLRPSELANLLGLTRGATTTVLGRLKVAGYLERMSNQQDARSHFVQLTAAVRELMHKVWQPVRSQGAKHLSHYSVAELHLLTTFMKRSAELHDACRAAIADEDAPSTTRLCLRR